MKLNYDKKSKDPTYFVQQGIRNGKKTTTKNVMRIGKHSELLLINTDPLAYAKSVVEKCNEEFKNGKVEMNLKIDFSKKIEFSNENTSKSNSLNIGYFILQKLYNDLEIKKFINDIAGKTKVTFPCNDINRFLTFARILDPKSKLGTFDQLDTYYEKPDFAYQHILRFMDVLSDNYSEYLQHLYHHSNNVIKRDTSVFFYDCSNYYFEIETEDDDYIDEVTGEYIKGLRKYGPSKDHKPNPIVQMGLFMDNEGIPITMCINSGSDNEQKSAIPLEKELIKMVRGKKFIYCADAGLGSLDIRKFNDMGGRSFIVTQSIKKLAEPLKQAVFNDFDYKLLSSDKPTTLKFLQTFDKKDKINLELYKDYAYKVIEVDSTVDLGLFEDKVLKNGKTKKVKSKAILKQRIIITFSRKTMEYQRIIRNKQIERAKKLIKDDAVEKVKKGSNDVTRFIKRTSKSKSGDAANINIYELDQEVIKKEEKYDGFYAIATNLADHPKHIISINSKRYKIEDCFRVLKTNFEARPIFHRNSSRIVSHFLFCFTALLIYRLLEAKLDRCNAHFTTDEILDTLKVMNVTNVEDIYYQSLYTGGLAFYAINSLFNLDLNKKYYLPKDLNKILKNISK